MSKNGFLIKTDSSETYVEIDMTSRSSSGSCHYSSYFKYKSISAGSGALKVPYHTSDNPFKHRKVKVTINNNYGHGFYFYYYQVPAQSNINILLSGSFKEIVQKFSYFEVASSSKGETQSNSAVFENNPKDTNFKFIKNDTLDKTLDKIYYDVTDPWGSYLWWNGGDYQYEQDPYMFFILTNRGIILKERGVGVIYECAEINPSGETIDSWSIGQCLFNPSSTEAVSNVPAQIGTLFDILAYEHWDADTISEKASEKNENTYSINIRTSRTGDTTAIASWFSQNLPSGSKYLEPVTWQPGDVNKALSQLDDSQKEALMCGALWRG